MSVLHFHGSAESIANPERGFRAEFADFPILKNLDVCTTFNLTLAQAYAYMWQFCTRSPCSPLSATYLKELEDGFARARRAGVKLLLRFAYENSSATPTNGPSSYEEIFLHMRQLAPVVQKNADVLHTIAAGFVGAYGEWHSSVHHLEANHSGSYRAKRSCEGLQISWTGTLAKVDLLSPPKPRRDEDELRQTPWTRHHGTRLRPAGR